MTRIPRMLLAVSAFALVAGLTLIAQPKRPAGAQMTDQAAKFLDSLSPDQKKKAHFGYDDPNRLDWAFTPQQKDHKPLRKGVRFDELTDGQKKIALELLRSALSAKGFEQATTIMSLESILADLEKNGAITRDPNWYFVTIFGDPSPTSKWGWRIEGHHLSVNMTLDRGTVLAPTPVQFASNPAVVKDGARKGLRALPGTEDIAKELIASLDDEQKKVARQAKQFPEINERKPTAGVGAPVGLPAAKMTEAQKAILWKLMSEYANRLQGDLAAMELKQVTDAGIDKVHFAYCIEENKPGKPYTYRVQGPTFVVEFLNVQADSAKNPANHIHSSWRHLPSDFALSP